MKHPIYEEEQRFSVWFVVLILILVTGLMWFGIIQQIIFGIPFGTNPASDEGLVVLWVIFGIGFPIFFAFIRLKTEIYVDGIYVQYFPFHFRKRRFEFDEIKTLRVETYHPLKEFLGYGLRFSFKGVTAYNVKGKQGIRIEMIDGKKYLIGTQEPEAIKEVLQSLNIDVNN
ncbi:DUF6141 family protein [Pseudalkalibacillus sp. SCS-8]|uniref:DUF6141 family protein n=1 Tax=Pseudalkalibacillus nanhaiensis TaxID=3115291 RepID=UPI0032DBB417